MATQIDKLLEQKRKLEAKIAKARQAEKEASRAKALKVLEASGLLDMPEAELVEALRGLKKPAKDAAAQ